MKSICLKIAVALLTFILGVGFAYLFHMFFVPEDFTKYARACPITTTKNISTSEEGTIEVRFRQFVLNEQKVVAEFEITNYSTENAFYMSHIEGKPPEHIRFNGEEEKLFRCGTGMRRFVLRSGDSMIVRIDANRFIFNLVKNGKLVPHSTRKNNDYRAASGIFKKKGEFQVGFGFVLGENKYREFLSQKFQIPDSVKETFINGLAGWSID